MKVLLAVDQSRYAMTAVRSLQRFLLPTDTELTLFHVIEPSMRGQASFLMQFPWYERALDAEKKELRSKAQELVDRLEKSLGGGARGVHSELREGSPGVTIVNAINEFQIDLAVIGSRGLSGVRKFLLGSVSEWVSNVAECSVLVVRGEIQPLKGDRKPGLRILLATDGSADARASLTLLDKLGLPGSSVVTILHVLERLDEGESHTESSIGMMSDWAGFIESPDEIKRAQEQSGIAILEEARQQVTRQQVRVEVELSRGDVAEQIINLAGEAGMDFVVLGAGQTAEKGSLMGSVARKVVRHAHCSVLVGRSSTTG